MNTSGIVAGLARRQGIGHDNRPAMQPARHRLSFFPAGVQAKKRRSGAGEVDAGNSGRQHGPAIRIKAGHYRVSYPFENVKELLVLNRSTPPKAFH
jgi:hypothetical protein